MTDTLAPVKPARLIINGQAVDAASGQTFTTTNPATEEPICAVAEGGAEDVDRAVQAARAAFDKGVWSRIAGAAEIWNALEACGLPEILGVWNHEGAPATRFTVIQIRQRYPGHARNVLHVASNCMAGAYNGKWTVVVDDDVDCSDIDQVLWAMGTRFDPMTDIDLVQKAWSSGRDPMFLPGNFNNRILIDACIPYNRKLRGEFPKVVEVPNDVRAQLKAKFSLVFK